MRLFGLGGAKEMHIYWLCLTDFEEISRGQLDRRQKGSSNEEVSSGRRNKIEVANNLAIKKFLVQEKFQASSEISLESSLFQLRQVVV